MEGEWFVLCHGTLSRRNSLSLVPECCHPLPVLLCWLRNLAVLLQVGNWEKLWVGRILSVQSSTFSQLQSCAAFWPLVCWFGVVCAYSKLIKLEKETKAQIMLQQ